MVESAAQEVLNASGETKRMGRFLVVVEQAGLPKTASIANLSESGSLGEKGAAAAAAAAGSAAGAGGMPSKSRSEAGKDVLGKPPIPTSTPSSSTLPIATVLPKLQELLDHAAQQQAALQKLVAAVQDVERGRTSPLLARTASTRSLFSDVVRGTQGSGGGSTVAPAGGGGAVVGSEGTSGLMGADSVSGGGVGTAEAGDMRASLDALRARLADVEAENAKLRQRNAQLEAALGQQQYQQQQQYQAQVSGTHAVDGLLSSARASNSNLPDQSLLSPAVLSPRETRVTSDDELGHC